MNEKAQCVTYWDSSSVLSALFKDKNSRKALEWSRKDGIHLISTLAYAEVCAVISRIKRERLLADVLINAAFEALETGPWRHLNIQPEWDEVKNISLRWPLRGADLWHLATAKILQEKLPELIILTFDKNLKKAAQAENLIK
ncbi:MAG: type II toxin-antitoxin system VapC family toxin [Candidatus Aminicenantales bacterium]